jgi:small redox-active disulfide protein 2
VRITVYGSPGCVSCDHLHQLVKLVLSEGAFEADLEYVTDLLEVAEAGIMRTPALVVDGELVLSGRVPRKRELRKLLPDPTTDPS